MCEKEVLMQAAKPTPTPIHNPCFDLDSKISDIEDAIEKIDKKIKQEFDRADGNLRLPDLWQRRKNLVEDLNRLKARRAIECVP